MNFKQEPLSQRFFFAGNFSKLTGMKRKNLKLPMGAVVLIVMVLLNTSCNYLGYSTSIGVNRKPDASLANTTLDIEVFDDKRSYYEEGFVIDESSEVYYKNGVRNCINAGYKYGNKNVTRSLSKLLYKHLKKVETFKKVFFNKKDSADYYVTGTFTRFYGIQYPPQNKVDKVMSQYGYVLKVLATSPCTIVFELKDLAIHDQSGRIVKDLMTYRREYSGNYTYRSNCSCIYYNVNQRLFDFNKELIFNLGEEIKAIKRHTK